MKKNGQPDSIRYPIYLLWCFVSKNKFMLPIGGLFALKKASTEWTYVRKHVFSPISIKLPNLDWLSLRGVWQVTSGWKSKRYLPLVKYKICFEYYCGECDDFCPLSQQLKIIFGIKMFDNFVGHFTENAQGFTSLQRCASSFWFKKLWSVF